MHNTFHPAIGECMTMVGRKPYLGAAAAAVLLAAAPDGIGMPGITGIADADAFRGVAPSADPNGLLGVAIEVQAGGTDTGPSVAALPSPAEIPLPAPPEPDRPEPAGSPSAAAIPDGVICSTALAPAPRNVEPVMACTTWAGLNAPVDVTVFQKFESTPRTALLLLPSPVSVPLPVKLFARLDSDEDPDVAVEVAVDDDVDPPDTRLCRAPATPDALDCTDVPVAALTAADWLANPAELVVWAGGVNDANWVAAEDCPAYPYIAPASWAHISA